MPNVSGWENLTNGKVVEATYLMYNSTFNGSFLLVMFIVLTTALLLKTKNVTLSFILGILFFAMFYSYFSNFAIIAMTVILLLELAGVLYSIFFKD